MKYGDGCQKTARRRTWRLKSQGDGERVGGSEMEMESGETANKLEKVIGETFKELGVCASGNAKNFRATKTWWKIKEGAKFMSSMFM